MLDGDEEIVAQLIERADEQDLIARTTERMKLYWFGAESEEADFVFRSEELRSEFGAQMLCFRGGRSNVKAPYIATNLLLHVFTYQVGWYEILTSLAGEIIRENSLIWRDYWSEGRASGLIERARCRSEHDLREWMGLVGLRSVPGNHVLPDGTLGGYLTCLALVRDSQEYQQHVEAYFTALGVDVEEIKDVEPLSNRLARVEWIDDEIFELAASLLPSQPVLRSNTIYTYTSDDEDNCFMYGGE